MASTILIFSPKCKHCNDVINFLESNPQLKSMVQFHNVNQLGIPPQFKMKIKSVPTLVTQTNNKILVGKEIIQWFTSLLPSNITNHIVGGRGLLTTNLGGGNDDDDSFFSLNSYGRSLQGAITPELEAKINRNVTDAFQEKPV